jgi:DNA-3-methyladenine glycosylase
MRKLPRDFYTRDVLRVARELPGKVFVKKRVDTILAGKIVEVEAYSGAADEAAHSFGGVTARNQVMFREGGILYVYFTYGMHYCCNVVTGREGEGNAVLLRAMEPLEGIETMMRNRFGESKKDFRRYAGHSESTARTTAWTSWAMTFIFWTGKPFRRIPFTYPAGSASRNRLTCRGGFTSKRIHSFRRSEG